MNNIAILVGCQYYSDEHLNHLNGVNYDVSIMKEALTNYCGCDANDIIELVNEKEDIAKPTGTGILKEIQKVNKNKKGKKINNLFFYFSGHGFNLEGKVHIIPSDAMPSIPYGTITVDVLKNELKAVGAVRNIIILDICQGGQITKGNFNYAKALNTEEFIIFYSCSPNQQSYMLPPGEGKGSLYTKFLVDALSSSKPQCTIRDISSNVKRYLDDYCRTHNIIQIPHTEVFDVSLGDVVITNNRHTPYLVIEQNVASDLNRSIWLVDAEKAEGEQSRFETFTDTTIVRTFVERNSVYWGIASVKGIGKTFLLQVKRLKMSRTAHCFPNVKPCRDNNWATECIRFTDEESFINATKSYFDLKLLWKYSLLCYILHSWLIKQKRLPEQKRNKGYNHINQQIIKKHDNEMLAEWTFDFLINEEYCKLQQIMEGVVVFDDWSNKIVNEYRQLQALGNLITKAIHNTSRNSLVLFLDKVDQAMRQPNSENPISCELCSKKELLEHCNNEKKDTQYCTSDEGETCPQRSICCYGCEFYTNKYAGSNLRINGDSVIGKRHYNHWQSLQLALIEAVIDIRNDFDGHIKVFYTVRLEACNYDESVWGDQRAKIMALTCILDYTRDEQKKIYRECIENQNPHLLFDSDLAKKPYREDEAFVGVRGICHPYVQDASESVFDIIYRHSFGRTRDIQDFGQALTARMQDIKSKVTEDERGNLVKQIIEETAARLAYNTNKATRSSENSYYFEKMPNMPGYWAETQNFENLLKLIDRNLLFFEDLRRICNIINEKDKCPEGGCRQCFHHPFSVLKNLGMLGYIVLSENGLDYSTQIFLSAQDITYFHDEDNLQINHNTLYLIHPALTKSIEKLQNEHKIMHFCRFLIGKDIQVQQSILREIFKDKQILSPEEFESKYYRFVNISTE